MNTWLSSNLQQVVKQLVPVGCENAFQLYRAQVKCVFHVIWQIDALTTKRGKEGGWVVERLLNQV